MKKALSILLALVLCLGLCACVNRAEEQKKREEAERLQQQREELEAMQDVSDSLNNLSDLIDQYKNAK